MRLPLTAAMLVGSIVMVSTAAQAQLQMQEQSVGGPMRRAPMPAGAAPAPPPTVGVPLTSAPRPASPAPTIKAKKAPKVKKSK